MRLNRRFKRIKEAEQTKAVLLAAYPYLSRIGQRARVRALAKIEEKLRRLRDGKELS